MRPAQPDAIATAWRAADLRDLTLRRLNADDFPAVAAVLRRGEGYTLAEAPTLATMMTELRGFGTEPERRGLVALDAVGAMAAILLFIERDRRRDEFGEGALLATLPDACFPPDGRFLQVYELWVTPAHRRRGVARALKLALQAEAAERAIGMIYTVTEVVHAAARRLNDALGYVELYRGPMWDTVERVALAKRLPAVP